jgi:hypothetical protein
MIEGYDEEKELGIEEIAKLLTDNGNPVTRGTVQLWNSKARAILPPPSRRVSNVPLWRQGDIIRWAMLTGRWKRSRVNRFDAPGAA